MDKRELTGHNGSKKPKTPAWRRYARSAGRLWKFIVGGSGLVALVSVYVAAAAAGHWFPFESSPSPTSISPSPTSITSVPTRTSVGPTPSTGSTPPTQAARKFLVGVSVASGDMPQIGLVIIGGQSYKQSLYYDNSVRVQTSYNTHFSLTENWKMFVAWVGEQPASADPLGCTRDAGSTYEILVDQSLTLEGVVPCGRTKEVSVSVAGAHDLDLVFNTHPFYIATGNFAWANAQLK